jgi:hypothetical protein
MRDELAKTVISVDACGMRETPDQLVPCRPQTGRRTRPRAALPVPMTAIAAAMTIRLEPLPATSVRARIARPRPRARHNSPLSWNCPTTKPSHHFLTLILVYCLYNPFTSSFDVPAGFID